MEAFTENEIICPLCHRRMAEPCNRHHLLPISKGGKGTETVLLHKICHNKIHAVFTESELKRYYHTFARIRENEEMAAFLRWVAKKPPEFYLRTERSKR